jgi:hypothetical protein
LYVMFLILPGSHGHRARTQTVSGGEHPGGMEPVWEGMRREPIRLRTLRDLAVSES